MVKLSHPYMTIGKTIALIRQTFVNRKDQAKSKDKGKKPQLTSKDRAKETCGLPLSIQQHDWKWINFCFQWTLNQGTHEYAKRNWKPSNTNCYLVSCPSTLEGSLSALAPGLLQRELWAVIMHGGLSYSSFCSGASPMVQRVKNLSTMQETQET